MKRASHQARKVLLTVLLLLWWPWCFPRPVCFAGPAEASVSIIFTRQADDPPCTSIAEAGSVFDISGAVWRSKYPIAPPGTYVTLCQAGSKVAGAWADPQGLVDFLVPCRATGSCSLLYSSKQSIDIAQGSIHRLSRQEAEAQPAATRGDYFLHLAYEGPGGQGELRTWNLETVVERPKYIWTSPSGPIIRPWVVLSSGGGLYYILHDIKTTKGFQLVFRVSGACSYYNREPSPVPHNPVAYAAGGLIYAYYTWPRLSVTAVGSENYMAHTGSPISGDDSVIIGPPNLSNLTIACMSNGDALLAGEENGRVYLYDRGFLRRSITGERPTIAPVSVSGQDRILVAYLTRQGPDTVVRGELVDRAGVVKGVASTLFTIPQAGIVRISMVQSLAGDCWLFWQGTCLGRNQIFVTKVALPW